MWSTYLHCPASAGQTSDEPPSGHAKLGFVTPRTLALTNEKNAGPFAAAVGIAVAIVVVGALMALLHPGDRAPLFMPLGITAFAVVFVPLFVLLRRVRLRAHADGLVVREGIGRRSFLPYDAIASVSSDGPTVVLTLRTGHVARWQVTPDGVSLTANTLETGRRERATAIAAEIARALQAHRSGVTPDATHTLALDRGESSPVAWLQALRRVGDGGVATFRQGVTPTRDELLAIATSPCAAPGHRVAAAVALRAALTDAETPRIRVAAESAGAPHLGERLTRVLDASSDADLAAILEEACPDRRGVVR
jgi:hypothetical protein